MNGKVKGVSDGNYKGFKIVSIDRPSFQDVLAGSSFFKLFIQAPPCDRPKTCFNVQWEQMGTFINK
jgi:hypothetical protein